MDVSTLHNYVSTKNGMSLQSLKKSYPNYDNIEDVITSSPELFWVATHNENHTEVRAKLDVKLCYLYLTSTCDGNCGCLHICKDYLLSRKFCPSVCKYGFSHLINDSHNRLLLPINKHSQWELLLRSSFPRLCIAFTSSATCNKEFCGYLHLCRDFVHNTCIGKCELETASGKLKADLHNCGNDHNKKVLNNFGLSHLKNDRKILFANILTKKNGIFDNTAATDLETKSSCSASSMSTANEVPFNRPLLLCANYLNGNCNNAKCPRLHFCKEFLVNGNKCVAEKCKFGFLHDLLIGNNKEIMERHALHNLPSWTLLEHVRKSFPRVCKEYQLGECSYEVCKKMHICQDYCSGTCKINNCQLSHEVRDKHNLTVLKSHGLDKVNGNKAISQNRLILINILFSKCGRESKNTRDSPNDRFTILLCNYYLKGCCELMECPRLHMCKEFLINGNKCDVENCRFGFSHDPLDVHNKVILTKCGVSYLPSWLLLQRLRNSFPRICKKYYDGMNCLATECNRMHICLGFCLDNCTESDCNLSHNLKDEHNAAILKSYSLGSIRNSKKYEKAYILSNVLFSNVNRKSVKTLVSKSTLTGNEVEKKATNESNFTPNIHSTTTTTTNLQVCTDKMPVVFQPSEKNVFDFILSLNPHGFCLITKLLELFGFQLKSVESWIEEHKCTFRTVSTHNGDKYVYLCLAEVRPCYNHWRKPVGCTRTNCHMFHICRTFLIAKSHNERTCKFNHDLKELSQQKLLQNLAWKSITEEQIIMLLKIRYPFVCTDYLDQKCQNGEELCPNLHVCYDFVRGSCKKQESLCSFKHETGIFGAQAKRLMREYQLNEREFRSCIILPKLNLKENMAKNNATILLDEFNWLKKEGICANFLVGGCEAERRCHLVHPSGKLPYLWQYKGKNSENWNNLPVSVNVNLEKEYCDPSSISYDVGDLFVLFSSSHLNWYGQYKTNDVTVRRLSTISSVNTIAVGATEWKWYWESGLGSWTEYENYTTSDDIENTYLKDVPSHTFATNEYSYELSLDTMKQRNLDERYQTERNVRRRPVYKDKDLIRQKKASISTLLALPLHWPKNFKQGERIPTGSAVYSKIKRSFQTSIAKSVEVLKVEEICNEPFYDKYGRKKMEFSKKMTDVKEMSLYHGTEWGVVDAICAQNFDWRLCGKNATMFGHGSYFSTSASYSHNYTTADPQLDIRYMFVADVLVGRYTKGDSSMKRPPLIPSSELELYDSCVNDVADPSIYVVFERDQCYPKYLISYKIRSSTQDGSSSSVYSSYQTSGVTSQTAPARRVSASTAPARQYSAAFARQVAASTAPVRQYSAAPVRQPVSVSAYNSSPSSNYGYGTSSTSYSTTYGGSNTNAMSASSSVSSSVNTGRNNQYSWDSRSSTSSPPTSRRQSQPTCGGQSSPSLRRSASVQEKKCVIS